MNIKQKITDQYEFVHNDYKFTIKYINLPNSTASGIVKIYKNDDYISMFCSVVIKPNKEEASFLNLNVNFNKCINNNKFNNDEILISRAIDKSLRPLLNKSGYSISINIIGLQMKNWIDMKFVGIFTSLAITKKIFDIQVGVSSLSIGKEKLYCGKYDRNKDESYIICTSSSTHINFLEVESNKLSNIKDIISDLIRQNNIIIKELNKISSMYSIEYAYDINHNDYLQNRIEYRKNQQHRPFNLETNASNNSLILYRGDTIILNHIQYNKSDESIFDHTYKSYGFASNELQNKQSRREIGHGDLIYKALYSHVKNNDMLKKQAIKMMSCVLNANGSTSMASVMAGSLNLLKEGFISPKDLLYAISFGVFMNHNQTKYNIICDMTAKEDNLSAMDIKIVQDNRNNVYAVQMDCRWPVSIEIINHVFDSANIKFQEIYREIGLLIDKTNLQHNIKYIMNDKLSTYLKKNPITLIMWKKILSYVYFNNTNFIHLQSNSINLNNILRFYINDELCVNDHVIIVMTHDINNSTDLHNDLHQHKFTRKQTFKTGDVIECIVKYNNKLSFVQRIS